MAGKSNDDPGFFDKIMSRIRGLKEGTPDTSDPSRKKVRFSIWYIVA
jgi:hypothetical protein